MKTRLFLLLSLVSFIAVTTTLESTAKEFTRSPEQRRLVTVQPTDTTTTPQFSTQFPIASPEVKRIMSQPFDMADETLLKLEDPVQVIVGSSHGTTSYIATFGNYSDAILSVTNDVHKRYLALLLLSMPHWKIPKSLDIDKEGKIRRADFYAFLWQDRVHEFWANEQFKLCLNITFGTKELANRFVQALKGEPFEVTY